MKTILALFFALSTLAPADAYKDEWNLIVKAYQQREITIWQAQDLLLEITEKYHPGNREQVAIIRRQVMDELVRIAKERDQRAYDAEMAAQRMRNREAQWAIEDAADAAISRHHNHGYRFR
jgi:rRNA-processing protein FCF1